MKHIDGKLLSAYLDGEVSAGERREIEAHHAACPECRRWLEDVRKLGEWTRALPEAALPEAASRRFRGKPSRRRRWGAVGVAAAVLFSAGTAVAAPGFADWPLIKGAAGFFGKAFFDEASSKSYTEEVNRRSTNEGVVVELTDVYYDQVVLTVGYEIQLPPALAEQHQRNRTPVFDAYVDGTRLEGNSVVQLEATAEGSYKGIYTIIPEPSLPDRFELAVEMTRLGTLATKGEWRFEFPVTATKTNHRRVAIEREFQIAEGRTLYVRDILMTPAITQIVATSVEPGDSDGAPPLSFGLRDETNVYQENKGGWNQTERTATYTMHFGPIPKDTEEIELSVQYSSSKEPILIPLRL
ncbi:zf-HC2 domain-containing protein [Paenibacillus sp. TRM 82003]|nr:zf-HC2 domain-containing protein [Paenibacillus sp. TRM 82003]